jgi:peptide/nickel transport system substrate-binding protein
VQRLDPHELDDPLAALFAAAICDPLYALDGAGRAYPALAEGLPEATAEGARVRLRAGLRSAKNKPLSAADVHASFERAKKRAGSALLPDLVALRGVRGDPLALDFVGATAATLGARLANPLLTLVPRDYSPLDPDGTGAFQARLEPGRLLLLRNQNAARGSAFLDRIEVRAFSDLGDALRAFEAGNVDVGWLGSGLHRPRGGAVSFTGIPYGWAVLRAGNARGGWGAPGVLQQLIDGVGADRLQHLGLEGLTTAGAPSAGWGGGPAEVLVADDAPQLALIARTLVTALSRPGNELTLVPTSRVELARKRSSREFSLWVDFVRNLGPKGPMTQLALLAAVSPELAKKPPRIDDFDARAIARGLPLGVIGELWATGAQSPAFQGLSAWQLGDVWRLPDPAPAP